MHSRNDVKIKFDIVSIVTLVLSASVSASQLQEEEISRWTSDLGVELWNLGKTITKFTEIQGKVRAEVSIHSGGTDSAGEFPRYQISTQYLYCAAASLSGFDKRRKTYGFLNAQVEKKDPEKLLNEVVGNIARMMDRKNDAVTCITQEAERVAETFMYNPNVNVPKFKYYSSKYSQTQINETIANPKLLDEVKKNKIMYRPMKLNNDTHFYNLAVNTEYSSVHVPTNIYDRGRDAAFAIKWSEELDKIFVRNYNSDPALSWQYFGSSSGIMRHYPAKRWNQPKKEDIFDCRIRTWFIEAATCTKDVVILLDNSGSMDGMGKHIGALTAFSVLDTFSNNDYINVLNYSTSTNYTIPCFEDMLVPSTRENIEIFKESIKLLKPKGKTKLDQALGKAFGLLSIVGILINYQEKRKCNESSRNCNQAIMVITDGVSKNLSEAVLKYNRRPDGSTPIRIFTYLIGEEVTNVNEIKWMACANRGYYTHVQTLEQVTSSVLKYIGVIARPLVLQAKEHPVSWTHAYIDYTSDENIGDSLYSDPWRLMTSAAAPSFDKRANNNNETLVAELLGVAGTDVPIADFEKLTFPYKLGVNAYSFIVSNLGYVLMHPDLRPIYWGVKGGMPTENYNSIDLTEVEQFDNDLPPREVDSDLLDLRTALVNGSRGSLLNISLKYHYDDMRRVTREQYDYYFAPLENTPFSVGLAFPHKYGHYSLDVGDEIMKNRHTGAQITDFFKGGNWKIHPEWVYCKYHYLEGHEFKTPELELLHFLGKVYNDDFVWEMQYEEEVNVTLDKVECGRKTHNLDDYYCDRQLVQRLIFDAKNTLGAFQGHWTYQSGESPLFKRYNATLRFVATMSGLTRWEYIFEEVENGTKKEFGDYHSRAIDETWYKSAVIQRRHDQESFVYSVPFDSGQKEGVSVTASYAIFPNDAGDEAPGSVVGFQFIHKNLKARVIELTTKVSNQCPECGTCNTTLDCYIIDSSGYIIVSENDNDTGKFFGEIEGDIMDSMLSEYLFEMITIYDFQAYCNRDDDEPMFYLRSMADWFILKITWLAVHMNFYNLISPIYAQILQEMDELLKTSTYRSSSVSFSNVTIVGDDGSSDMSADDEDKDDDEEEEEEEGAVEDDMGKYYACEKQRDLFILKQDKFTHDNYQIEIMASRTYYVKKIPYSNLLFVAINSTMPVSNYIKYSSLPKKIVYDNYTLHPCQKIPLNNYYRRSLRGCFNEDPQEINITVCSKAAIVNIRYYAFLLIGIIYLCTYTQTNV